MLPYLRLIRAGTLFSPAADILAGLCLAGAPWSLGAARLVLASVALYGAGMILNDHADRKLDALQRPERPIPRGQIRPGAALTLGAALLILCLTISPVPLYHLVMVALVLGYDYVLKRGAFTGALVMGTLRAMNLLTPAFWINHVDDLRLLVIAGGGYGVYIVAVTLLGILEDAPKVDRRAVLGLVSVPPLTAALVVYGTPDPWPAAAIGFGLAGLMVLRHRKVDWTQQRIREAMTWLLLGTMIYTGLLALGCGRPLEALVIFAMIVPARVISRRIALT